MARSRPRPTSSQPSRRCCSTTSATIPRSSISVSGCRSRSRWSRQATTSGTPAASSMRRHHEPMKRIFVIVGIIAAVATTVIPVVSGFSRTVVDAFSPTVIAQSAPKQAVVDTAAGTFVLDLTPETAPNQAAYFIKLANDGAYDGTTFHRVIKYGMVQGGDPLSKDPDKRALYGTGGLNAVKAEARAAKMTRGAVAAGMIQGNPDSAGSQFFIVLADQPALDNQYTVFGHVAEGIEVLQKISEAPVDDKGIVTTRIAITRVTIRDTPADPFMSETPSQLAAYRAVLDTSAGPITIEFLADKAPETVR